MTSFIAAGGSGRSASFIPAVPAAWSVTTIAFIVRLPVSSPRLHNSRSTPCPRIGYQTETDRSGSWPRPLRCEMRNEEWPYHVSFIGVFSSLICLGVVCFMASNEQCGRDHPCHGARPRQKVGARHARRAV